MNKKKHSSIKENFIDATIIVSAFSFVVIFIASIILFILYLCFMFGNADNPVLKENWNFVLGAILSLITIFLAVISAYYTIEYFFPLEKHIPIYILATINIITFTVSVILYVNLLI